MEAVRFIVDMLLWLLALAFMLRFLFQLVRADFRDPMADAIVRVTNWLILPLRRVLPPVGKIDTATVVSVVLIAALRTEALFALEGAWLVDPLLFTRPRRGVKTVPTTPPRSEARPFRRAPHRT